jgi:serine/threonine protein kinase
LGINRQLQLKSNLSRATRTNGAAVILKLIDRDCEELVIHRLLNGIKSASNHTISLIGEITTDLGTIIALPEELPLPHAPSTLFNTNSDNLMRQFLEGVQFMHQQNVAHLDLKPDNIVIRSANELRLLIIDFSVSVQVGDQESWIQGYRGTHGWVAPEVGDMKGADQKYRPIRADLWSTGLVLQYIARRRSRRTDYQYKSLVDKLLDKDPLERPLLSNTPIEQNLQGPKRKLEIDAREEEGKKRRCLQSAGNFVFQDPPSVHS